MNSEREDRPFKPNEAPLVVEVRTTQGRNLLVLLHYYEDKCQLKCSGSDLNALGRFRNQRQHW